MAFKIYNTLTGEKDPLSAPKAKNGKLRLFVCGPTVYDYPHIGNARTFMTFDIIVRYLRSRGAKIFYLQNITDIDDKIIQKAREEKTDWKTIAVRYDKIYRKNMRDLNVTSVDRYAPATKFIPQIISQVQRLITKGHAYLIEGDGYYFDLSTFPDYGHLARRTLEQAEDATSRVDSSDKKRNKGDFALWKFSLEGEPGWKTELGFGRPGWHIEDTAITETVFKDLQYELHGGALDLKFPHHEAEIAQAEGISGIKPFVQVWMHAGFLFVDGKKMSKSLGNFITIEDLLKKYSANAFRMMVLAHHYRTPLDFSDAVATSAKKNLTEFLTFLGKLMMPGRKSGISGFDIQKYKTEFESAMEDDFNTPKALAVFFDLMSEANPKLADMSKSDAKAIHAFLSGELKNLGINVKLPNIPSKIRIMARKRELYRRSKQFMQADALRKDIDALGYTVDDTPMGPYVSPKA